MIALFEAALANPDPWQSIEWCHEQVLVHQSRNRGLKELLLGMTPEAPDRAQQIRAELRPPRNNSSNVVKPPASCGRTA